MTAKGFKVVLRASEPCNRRAWFDSEAEAAGEPVRPDLTDTPARLRMSLGTAMQAPINDELKRRGFSVSPHDQSVTLAIRDEAGNELRGHPDAYALEGDPSSEDPSVVEIKTTGPSRYKRFATESARGLEEGVRGGYMKQLRRYVALGVVAASKIQTALASVFNKDGINGQSGLIAVMNRDSCALQIERVFLFTPWDDHIDYLRGELAFATEGEPDIPDGFNRNAPPCVGCRWYDRCWLRVDTTPDELTIELARDMDHVRSLKDEAAWVEDEVKSVIKREMSARNTRSMMLGARYRATMSNPKSPSRRANLNKLEADGLADDYITYGDVPKPSLTIKPVTAKESTND